MVHINAITISTSGSLYALPSLLYGHITHTHIKKINHKKKFIHSTHHKRRIDKTYYCSLGVVTAVVVVVVVVGFVFAVTHSVGT